MLECDLAITGDQTLLAFLANNVRLQAGRIIIAVVRISYIAVITCAVMEIPSK
jgi:hypothetical protein